MDEEKKEHVVIDNPIQVGPPNEALFFVLAYLPLFELLSTSLVCRSLRDAVNNDTLPWLNIIVKRPLTSKLSDDILVNITSKANGLLRTLALISCVKITDDGLQRVIDKNPHINKLYVPSCTGLTPEGVIRAVKTLTIATHTQKLKSLKISGIYNITKQHLQTLISYLDMYPPLDYHDRQNPRHLYPKSKNFSNFLHEESKSVTHTDIDIDICPKCDEVTMVFDCSKEACECRGCYFCIPRCEECGGCVEHEELEEVACVDILCSNCWLKLPKCDLCNKPYCSQHYELHCGSSGSSGFVCDVCQEKCYRCIDDDDDDDDDD